MTEGDKRQNQKLEKNAIKVLRHLESDSSATDHARELGLVLKESLKCVLYVWYKIKLIILPHCERVNDEHIFSPFFTVLNRRKMRSSVSISEL